MRARQNPPSLTSAEKAAIIRRAHAEAKAAHAQNPRIPYPDLFGEAMRRLHRAYAEGWLTEHCGATPADLAQLRAVSDGSYGYLQGKFRAAQRGRPDRLEARIDAAAGRLSEDPEVQSVIRCGFPQPPRGQGRVRPAPIPVAEVPPARVYLGESTGKPREQVLAEAMLKGDFSRRFERDEINDIASEMERIAPQQGKPSRVFKQFGQPVSRKATEVWSAYRMVLEQIWANDGVNGSWAKPPASWKYRSPKGVFEFAERLPVADQEREGLVLIPTSDQLSTIIGATKDHFLDSGLRPILDKYREMAPTDYIRAFHSVRESVQTYVERTFGDVDETILHPRIKPLVESLLDWDSVKTDKLRLSQKWTKEHTSHTKAHAYSPLDEAVAQLTDSVSSVLGAIGLDQSSALVYINEFKSDIKNQIDEAVKLAGPYRYGLLVRPVASYTVPSGFSEFGSDPSFKYGTVTYATKLPIKDQAHFDLMLIPTQAQRQIIEADLLSFMLFEHYRRLANYRETISEDVDFYLKAFEGMLEDIARERWGAINHADARDIYKKVANTLLRE